MKPLKLEFCGINSFSEHTIIDFESLTRGGLFGIFGDTGSGKSTILDCINFALYGSVERSKGKTDIINTRSNAAYVRFVFDILNEGKRKRYTVERTIKKDKSGTHKAMLYEADGETESCIADKASAVEKKITEILGVEAEDFRKCIALPQGEFAQFVKSAPAERLALIERLFNLSRYGDSLKEKISARQKEVEMRHENLSGRMSAYDGVTEEQLKADNARLKEGQKRLKERKEAQASADKRFEKQKALCEKRVELEETLNALKNLDGKRAQMEDLRRDLKALPKCLEAAATEKELRKKAADIEKLTSDVNACAAALSRESAAKDAVERELTSVDFDGQIAKLTGLAAAFATCEGKPERLKELSEKLAAKRAEYKRAEGALASLEGESKIAEEGVARAEKQWSEAGDGTEKLLDVNLRGAVLRGEYAQQLDWLATFRGDVRVYEDESPLFRLVSVSLDERIGEYRRRLSDLQGMDDDLSALIGELQSAQKAREQSMNTLNECRRRYTELIAEIRLKKSELQRIADEGSELRARSDELERELKKVFGEATDTAACTERNRKALDEAVGRKKALTERQSALQVRLAELGAEEKKLNALRDAAEAERDRLCRKLNDDVAASGMRSREQCLSLAEEFAGVSDAEKTLEEYDRQVAAHETRRAALLAVEGIASATDESLRAVAAERAGLAQEVEDLTRSLAVSQRRCDEMKEKLREKAALQKELNVCSHERDLVYQLKEATKGNKFLEFIANEYLCDVSSLASSTLLRLTDGRYFLVYKDNTFNVGDNFDCGNLRGVNTLSGGETFLVSLSLALALSQTICSRSRKSIEFFFLDEGFGTLDSMLVDTVMSALEKLKSSNFTIGVISHVEELKHRIDSKITVIKATERKGSSVKIDC